ncbi:MAG: EAL domain-containing protein [Pseudomonadota bacterium]|nr:EAL domain-containing protein [Pseudomonadota bacterium]
MKKPIRILFLLEFDAAIAATESLDHAGFDVSQFRALGAAEFENSLLTEKWDAVIADLDLPTLPGFDALEIYRSTDLDIPFILMSSTFVEEIAVSSIKAGANDYVTRDRLARLAPVLERELAETQLRSAHRRARRDLTASEERFRSLTALSSDWYWEQDEELRFTYVSSSQRDKYSEALESWAGKRRWELPYRNADWTLHRATVEARKPFYDVQLQPFRHDGSIVHVSVSGEAKFDARGKFLGYRGVGKDITERVKDAEALRLFRTAMDTTVDAITLVSRAAMRFVEVNATAAQMLGYARNQLLQLGPQDVSVIPRDKAERAYDSLIAGENTYAVIETQLQRADGSLFHVEIRQHAQRAGGDWIIVGVVRDHTERRDAEQKLRGLNRLYAMASATNALVIRARDRDELFRNACNIVVDHGQFERAWVGLLDEKGTTIVPTACAGLDDAAFAAIRKVFLARGQIQGKTLAARAMREKAPVISNNVQNDAERVASLRYAEPGTRSLAVLPLIISEKAVGVFVLYTTQLEFFDADGLLLLTDLAGNVAFALDQIQKQDRFDYLAYYDVITGLANRRLFLDRLTQFMRSAANAGHKLALFMIDLERFKKINDTLGRNAGDELLRLVAAWLVQNAGDSNVLARVDADHFAVVLPEVSHEAEVARVLEKTIEGFLNHSFQLEDTQYRIAAKVGVAVFPDDGSEADTLFKNAESALKKAKVGGDRYLFYAQKMTETVAGSLGLENRLRQALDNEEFVLHYQPKVSIANGAVTGAEALLRWQDPRAGLVPPARFIPLLEETGLIHEVGRWALQKALEDYQRWRKAGLPAVRIAVNVSPLQLRNRQFVTEIEQAIAGTADAAAGLEIELTESLIMEDVDHSIGSLRAVRALGVTVAIDDFGTGFSSLSYLSKLPVDTLKIDRSFIRDMNSSVGGRTLVSVIINLAHALQLKVVAEGVETMDQLHELKLLRCDEIQGYLIGRPVPAEIFEQKYLIGSYAA